MSVLRLAVKAEYFNAIKAGTKTEEYRQVSEHWFTRIAMYCGELRHILGGEGGIR